MLKSLDAKMFFSLMVGLVLLVLVGVATVVTLQQFEEAALVRTRTFQVMAGLEQLVTHLKAAESNQRGYLLAGNPAQLRSYKRRVGEVPRSLAELRALTLDPRMHKKIDALELLIDEKVLELQETLELDAAGNREQALDVVRSDRGQMITDQIRVTVDDMLELQEMLLAERTEKVWRMKMLCIALIGFAIALSVVLNGAALWVIRRDMRERQRAELALAGANEQLGRQVDQLNARDAEAAVLRAMTNQLQSCESSEEAYRAIEVYGNELFDGRAGAVYGYNASRDLAEAVTGWGNGQGSIKVFAPQDCWALRLGHEYRVDLDNPGLRCGHVDDSAENYLCVPMLAQGNALGLLHVEYGNVELQPDGGDALMRLAGTVADQVAPALVNLKLRETLKQKSIRDPLTGLFNRRFLEESLARELAAADRRGRPVTFIMIDLDHFKNLNDTFGHDAGDAMLSAVGQLLESCTRAEDIACRYGGEELALILPDIDLEAAVARAQAICDKIRDLHVRHNSNTLHVTASFGVATYPQHGNTGELLLRAADLALYQAKKQGRDRVVSA